MLRKLGPLDNESEFKGNLFIFVTEKHCDFRISSEMRLEHDVKRIGRRSNSSYVQPSIERIVHLDADDEDPRNVRWPFDDPRGWTLITMTRGDPIPDWSGPQEAYIPCMWYVRT